MLLLSHFGTFTLLLYTFTFTSSHFHFHTSRLSSQLEDAKEISSMVNRRLPGVLDSLEARVGEERRREFLECLDRRTQVQLRNTV